LVPTPSWLYWLLWLVWAGSPPTGCLAARSTRNRGCTWVSLAVELSPFWERGHI
jgi:hypothetical protein